MTCKAARQALRRAVLEQKEAHRQVREANARVVEETSSLPPIYVDERFRFKPGQRSQIEKLISVAQKASDRLALAISEVVNKRSAVESCGRRPTRR